MSSVPLTRRNSSKKNVKRSFGRNGCLVFQRLATSVQPRPGLPQVIGFTSLAYMKNLLCLSLTGVTMVPMTNNKGLGNRNAARKLGVTFMLTLNGQQVAGISQITARLEFAGAEMFPLVFRTSQAVKAFLRKAERNGNDLSQYAVAVTAIGSNN